MSQFGHAERTQRARGAASARQFARHFARLRVKIGRKGGYAGVMKRRTVWRGTTTRAAATRAAAAAGAKRIAAATRATRATRGLVAVAILPAGMLAALGTAGGAREAQ